MHSRAHDFPTFPNLCFLGKSGRSIVGKNLSHDPSSTDPSVDQRRTRGLNLTARDAHDRLENIQDIHHSFLPRIKYSPGLHWMGKRRRGWFVNNRSLILPRSETCVTETLFSPISYKLLFYLLVFLFFSFLFLERERERKLYPLYSFHSGREKKIVAKVRLVFQKSYLFYIFAERFVRSTNKSRKRVIRTCNSNWTSEIPRSVFLCNFVPSCKSSRISR